MDGSKTGISELNLQAGNSLAADTPAGPLVSSDLTVLMSEDGRRSIVKIR